MVIVLLEMFNQQKKIKPVTNETDTETVTKFHVMKERGLADNSTDGNDQSTIVSLDNNKSHHNK